ncbi:MAG TPA: nucleoside triphosphate pyrophosphohydrolase [Gammaproteobacteria bacterium]
MAHRELGELLALMATLRDPQRGCPWDQQQTFSSIAPYTLEEAFEVADAIEQNDMMALREELGDLLFQVVFHARMAEEAGQFAFADVVAAITEKMIRRHPHVFADAEVADAAEQTRRWEAHKANERAAKSQGESSLLDGVALGLPALTRAEKLQKRAARVGFDWPEVAGVIEKVDEELREVEQALAQGEAEALQGEIGDLLFSVVNLARHSGIDAEQALRAANLKFERRFRAVERAVASQGKSIEKCSLEELDAAWERVKGQEKR